MPRKAVYQAFLDRDAVASWLPPETMTGRVHTFGPREGGVGRCVGRCDRRATFLPSAQRELCSRPALPHCWPKRPNQFAIRSTWSAPCRRGGPTVRSGDQFRSQVGYPDFDDERKNGMITQVPVRACGGA